jgi:hypothetical protein
MGVSGQHHAPAALYPRGKDPRYPLYRRLGGSQSRCGHRGYRKNPLSLPGIEPRSPGHPARSHTLYCLFFWTWFIVWYYKRRKYATFLVLSPPTSSGKVPILGPGIWINLFYRTQQNIYFNLKTVTEPLPKHSVLITEYWSINQVQNNSNIDYNTILRYIYISISFIYF